MNETKMNNETKTIRFDDGYEVEFRLNCVRLGKAGKSKSPALNVSHFREVTSECPAASVITAAGKRLSDYLFAQPGGQVHIIRSGNGVREEIERRNAEQVEAAARDAAHKLEREAAMDAARAACGLVDPVHVTIQYFDGMPNEVFCDGEKLPAIDWSKVRVGNFSFAERSAVERALAVKAQAAEQFRAEVAAKQAARDAKLDAAIALAKSTGTPQEIARWTTDRCSCNLPDCSFDNAVETIDGNGRKSVAYTHCY